MYDEFPTVYETTLELKWIYFIILGVFGFIILLVSLISLARIFKKANRSGISAFIPFYNLIVLLEITNSSKWYFLFLLIPVVNLIFYVIIMFSLASSFRKTRIFALGLTFLPFIFYPILGFSNNEYMGINLEAMEGKTINVDIPKIVDTDEKQEPMLHEEKDTSLENINISIGGGIYQKNYTDALLQVDEEQTISNTNQLITSSNSTPNESLSNHANSSNLTFIQPVEEKKELLKEETLSSNISFPELIHFNPNTTSSSGNSVVENTTDSTQSIITPFISQKETENQNITKSSSYSLGEIKGESDSSSTSVSLEKNSEFASCPKCGAKIKSNAKICFLCGTKLN